MAKYVRVRDTSGHEINVRGDVPEGHPRGVKPGMEVLDKDPLGRSGEQRVPTYRVPLGAEPAPSATSVPRTRRKPQSEPGPTPVEVAEVAPDETTAMQADTEKEN